MITFDNNQHRLHDFIGCCVRDGLRGWVDDEGFHAAMVPRGPLTPIFCSHEAMMAFWRDNPPGNIISLPGWRYQAEPDGHAWYIEAAPRVGIKWTPLKGWRGTWDGHGLDYYPEARVLIKMAYGHAPRATINQWDLHACWVEDSLLPVPLGRTWWREQYPVCRDLFDQWEQMEDQMNQWEADGCPPDPDPDKQHEIDQLIARAIQRATASREVGPKEE